jgi:DNA repair exonuclease SbcCD ATPase subunit
MTDTPNPASSTEMWEMAREPLEFPGRGRSPKRDALAALDSLRTRMEELEQESKAWEVRFHDMQRAGIRQGQARRKAEQERDEARAENERLKAAYSRLVERLRLATPQSLMEVTPDV